MKPDIKHYPKWLREEVCPDLRRMVLSRNSFIENEKALEELQRSSSGNNIHKIVFILVIESIRNKFKIYEMEKEIENLQEQINDLKRRNK